MKGTQPKAPDNRPGSRALIEDVLDLTPVGNDSTTFTNTEPLWRPPGNRGIFGGIVIAQTLAAAQRTVPTHAAVTSMHCYFVFAGDGEVPIVYYVDRIVDDPGIVVRMVRAMQGETLIFTATLHFCPTLGKSDDIGSEDIVHSVPPPASIVDMPDSATGDDGAWDSGRPFQTVNAGFGRNTPNPEERKGRQWARARGPISSGQHTHLGALAYLTDSFLLGTVYRAHSVPRFSSPSALRRLTAVKAQPEPDREALHYFQTLADMEATEILDGGNANVEVGMMVSLSHSIYFHRPREVKADEWMFSEMKTPWAGDGRGLVTSRWWSRSGELIASCVQEGVMRLREVQKGNPRDGKL